MTTAATAPLVVASIVRDGIPHRVALAVETAGAVQRETTVTLAPGVVYDLAAALAGAVEDPADPRPPVVSDDGDTYEIDATVSGDGDTYEIGG